MKQQLSEQYRIFDKFTFYFDFDGILSSTMLYNTEEKIMKSAQYGARHAIELIKLLGGTVNVITGDASGSGNLITNKILSRIPIDEILYVSNQEKLAEMIKRHSDKLGSVYYMADDLFDCVTAQYIKTIVPGNSFEALKDNAHFVSNHSASDYFAIEALTVILYDIAYFYATESTDYIEPIHNSLLFNKIVSALKLTKIKLNQPDVFTVLSNIDNENLSNVETMTRKDFCQYLINNEVVDKMTILDLYEKPTLSTNKAPIKTD